MNSARLSALSLFSMILASGILAPAAAQVQLEEIVITASRFPEEAGKVGSAVTVLTREDFAAANAENVGELLEKTPGVTVNQAGGVGGTASVSIRSLSFVTLSRSRSRLRVM